METKYVEAVISNDELAKLITLAKAGDQAAMTEIIILYREDIQNNSKYIKMSKEVAFQSIITDFIELLTKDDKELEFSSWGGVWRMEGLMQAISTVGFPIVAFLLIFWKFDKSLGLLTEAVNNNTTAVQLLLQKRIKTKINDLH